MVSEKIILYADRSHLMLEANDYRIKNSDFIQTFSRKQMFVLWRIEHKKQMIIRIEDMLQLIYYVMYVSIILNE
jgi:hypothetical protein